MKRWYFTVLLIIVAMFDLGLGCISASRADTPKQVYVGTLVDITCATFPKKDLAKLRLEHTRKCLLMPVCSEMGYALLTDHDEVLRFDAKGNNLARELIERHSGDHGWRISVHGSIERDHLSVVHIKLLRSK